jgi:branched-chain amino acid transport system permease protein
MATYRPCGTRNFTYEQDMAVIRTPFHWGVLVVGLIVLFASPLWGSPVTVNLMNYVGITVIAALGLTILTGFCGQISIGQSAFMAVGAYVVGYLANRDVNFLVALPAGAVFTGLVGIVFGLPSVRIKGFYLAMATLAAQFVMPALIAHPLAPLTGGTDSLRVPPPQIWGLVCDRPSSLFLVVMPITVLLIFFAVNLSRTGIGRAFVAIRDDDLAAEVMGINVFRYKLLAFFICSAYAGMAGGLWAYWLRSINPEQFTLSDSILYLAMLIVGGMGSVIGAVFGAIALRVLHHSLLSFSLSITSLFPGWASSTGIQQALPPIVFGAMIVLFLVYEPRGLAHRWEVLKSSYRLRPFSY